MKKLLFFLIAFCFVTSAKAAFDCSAKPTCSSLGYIHESSAKCHDQVTLRCPFDTSYVFCGENTVELNCKPGDFFDTESLSCYRDDTESNYIFIKYNNAMTKAYLLDLTRHNSSKQVETYEGALVDSSDRLLKRGLFDILLSAEVPVVGLGADCHLVRNGNENEIVFVQNGAISSVVTTEQEYTALSGCGKRVMIDYYVRVNLY